MASPYEKLLCPLLSSNPWTWIAAIYGLQTVASIAMIWLLDLRLEVMVIPVALLVAGTLISLLFRRVDLPGVIWTKRWWFPSVIYLLFIFFLSDDTPAAGSLSFNTSLFHPIEYMTLGIFFCWLWYPVLQEKGPYHLLWRVLLVGVLWGGLDEVHQSFVPGRSPDLIDVCLDGLGLIMGYGVFLVLARLCVRLRGYEAS